jgi:hypothetical protein
MSKPAVRLSMHESRVIVDDGCGTSAIVNVEHAPRLLRDLAEATATACGWESSTAADSPEAGHVTLGCAHGATSLTPAKARALAVALLRAADEAEATP